MECRDRTSVQNLTLNTSLNVASLPIPEFQVPLAARPVNEKILNPRAGADKGGGQGWELGGGGGSARL